MTAIQLFFCISGIVAWALLIFGIIVSLFAEKGEPPDEKIYRNELRKRNKELTLTQFLDGEKKTTLEY